MVFTDVFITIVAAQHYNVITFKPVDLPNQTLYNQINNSTRELLCVRALVVSYKN